jgi:transcriptional regulator with XRE-family HTH domain
MDRPSVGADMPAVHPVCTTCIRDGGQPGRWLAFSSVIEMVDAWCESPAVLKAVEQGDTGTVIRLARRAKGETQRQTGDACGYSQSEISRIENGRARLYDIRTLGRLAQHLHIPPHLLGLADDDVRRRDFLREAAAGAAGVILAVDLPGRSGLLSRVGANLIEPSTLVGLDKRIARAHASYQRGEYQRVADGLPSLIGPTTDGMVLAEDEPTRQRVLVAQGWTFVLAAKVATKLGQAPTARLAADRAVTAAAFSGSLALRGAATYQLACALEAAGEPAHAEQVAVIGADHLADAGRRDPAVLSVRGALLLIAAITASAQGDAASSGRYLTDAQHLGDDLGADRNHAWTGFGPTNVRTHALAAAVRLDQPDRAVEIADRIDTERFPPGLVGRRCQVHLDAALAHARRGRDAEAVDRLLRAERIGPQVLRVNRPAQQLIADLLQRSRRSAVPGLRSLAPYAASVAW